MDIWDKRQRSAFMASVRTHGTRPEIVVRKALFSLGLRYRLNVKSLPGRPDLVLPRHRLVIFVNGCFWHGHRRCPIFKWPRARAEWWREKIEGNRKRDTRKARELRRLGWRVATVWECQTRDPAKLTRAIDRLQRLIEKSG